MFGFWTRQVFEFFIFQLILSLKLIQNHLFQLVFMFWWCFTSFLMILEIFGNFHFRSAEVNFLRHLRAVFFIHAWHQIEDLTVPKVSLNCYWIFISKDNSKCHRLLRRFSSNSQKLSNFTFFASRPQISTFGQLGRQGAGECFAPCIRMI